MTVREEVANCINRLRRKENWQILVFVKLYIPVLHCSHLFMHSLGIELTTLAVSAILYSFIHRRPLYWRVPAEWMHTILYIDTFLTEIGRFMSHDILLAILLVACKWYTVKI